MVIVFEQGGPDSSGRESGGPPPGPLPLPLLAGSAAGHWPGGQLPCKKFQSLVTWPLPVRLARPSLKGPETGRKIWTGVEKTVTWTTITLIRVSSGNI